MSLLIDIVLAGVAIVGMYALADLGLTLRYAVARPTVKPCRC
jgi:branched-subunit amino acid ABC-type transport system permease component